MGEQDECDQLAAEAYIAPFYDGFSSPPKPKEESFFLNSAFQLPPLLLCSLPHFHLGQLTKHNVAQIAKLNSVTLPVKYAPRFYEDLSRHYTFSRLGYVDDIMVGAICCRVRYFETENWLYIMTLSILEPYRRYGVASHLLRYIVGLATQQEDLTGVFLHVWTLNESAINFYLKHGFVIGECIRDYYHELTPSDCYILSCKLPSSNSTPAGGISNCKVYDATTHSTFIEDDMK
ncbi:acetyltransferase, GnaT family protein [Cardiosporidium cionae]|uniref:Acetyltransferase, GnaT family protein n=1 Tax=Cardiosporidium cionae TaxID=476202 RepID=A0ABQ7J8J6_9APIC|nr:acetyltransferase, GnaT family protein [Cardiosporidium cionae]|eukprot:KAF8820259.1 acetyltransferase, GnaT family protein [Cardiosporidium cionae]